MKVGGREKSARDIGKDELSHFVGVEADELTPMSVRHRTCQREI